MLWGLQSCPTTVLSEKMWHIRGSRHALTPLTYIQGVRTPTPVIYDPACGWFTNVGCNGHFFLFLRHFLLFIDVILRVSLQNITAWTSMRVWYMLNSTCDVTCRIPLSLGVEAVCVKLDRLVYLSSSSSSSFSLIISWQAQPVHNIDSEQYNRYTIEVQHVQLNAINMN